MRQAAPRGEISRYIIAGGLTTLVNFAVFYLFDRWVGIDVNLANTISVVCAVLFAYVINKRFVFRSRSANFPALIREAGTFLTARAATMALEVGGVFLLTVCLHLSGLFSKILTNVLVLILNYVFSKKIIFRSPKT